VRHECRSVVPGRSDHAAIEHRDCRQRPAAPALSGRPGQSSLLPGQTRRLAFEKPVGASANRRHHVRLWQVLDRGQEGRAVWLGAATFDRGVGLSHDDGRITHHIAADIDADRELLTAGLRKAKVTEKIYEVTGIGPTINGRNGEGDAYHTDGEVKISVLVDGCNQRVQSTAELDNPPLVTIKNAAWNVIASWLSDSTNPPSPDAK